MKLRRKSSKIASTRFVVFVGDEGAILVHLIKGNIAKRLFSPHGQLPNVRGFLDLFNANPDTPISVLVDILDQNYVQHTFPPVSVFGINALIQRRIERDFAPQDLTGSIPLGREKKGRKDWNYLLVSLAYAPPLSAWIDLLSELPNRLEAISLVPVEAADFIADLSRAVKPTDEPPAKWQILISHHKVGGFRQVVLKEGKLIFTRLTQPVGEASPGVIAGNIEQEVLNTIEYLKRLSFDEASGLDLYLIVDKEVKSFVDAGKLKANFLSTLTPYDAARKLDLEQAAQPSDHFGDVLLAASFGLKRRPRLKLSTPYIRRLERLYSIRSLTRAVVWLAAAGILFMCGTNAYDFIMAHRESSRLEREMTSAQSTLQTLRDRDKQLPADVKRIIEIVTPHEVFAKNDKNPITFLSTLAGVLTDDIRLQSVKWDIATPASGVKAAPLETVEIEIEFRHPASADQFRATSKIFFDKLTAAFPNYAVEYTKVPGVLAENEPLQLNLGSQEETGNAFATDKPVLVTLTLKERAGNKGAPAAPGAGAPTLAPPIPGRTP